MSLIRLQTMSDILLDFTPTARNQWPYRLYKEAGLWP